MRGVQEGNSFMAQSSHKVIHPESTYDVVELIGTSTESWEDAAKNVIEQAGEHLRELRVAEVVDKDMVIRDGKVELYRTKVNERLGK
jgi:dodecin